MKKNDIVVLNIEWELEELSELLIDGTARVRDRINPNV